jgi:hypothetical protein
MLSFLPALTCNRSHLLLDLPLVLVDVPLLGSSHVED